MNEITNEEYLNEVFKPLQEAMDKNAVQLAKDMINGVIREKKVNIPKKKIEIEVTRIIKETISRCYHDCPYFELDGGPGPVMCRGHPYFDDKESYSNFIISHPDCDEGFPEECPLLKIKG